jgi:predicted DNA-binding protein YlxM (UPF0122 family)
MTCDIKKSREMENRKEIQESLKNVLSNINKKYEREILANFMITLGDEFQGVLKGPKKCYDIYLDMWYQFPVKFYCGIGIGEIETEISDKPIEMDGPAFHQSREALKEAKISNRDIMMNSANERFDKIVNSMLALINLVKNGWTHRQKEIIKCYKSGEMTYEKVAKRFGVTKQYVSKVMQSTYWKDISEAEETIRKMLREIYQ